MANGRWQRGTHTAQPAAQTPASEQPLTSATVSGLTGRLGVDARQRQSGSMGVSGMVNIHFKRLTKIADSVDISRENRFAANTLALASGGWNVMERDETGRRGTGRGGEGRGRKERDRTGREGRDRMERDGKGWGGTVQDREGLDDEAGY